MILEFYVWKLKPKYIILLFKIKSLNVIEGCQMLSFNERYIIFTNCVFKFEFIKVYLEININLFIFLIPFKINKCTNGHEQIINIFYQVI